MQHNLSSMETQMNKTVIFNLPVKDLAKSRNFFTALGFTFKPEFSSQDAAFMVVVEGAIEVMLTTEPFFRSLINKPVVQAKEANEVVICLSCESREEVDSLIGKAAGAASAGRPRLHVRPGLRGPGRPSLEPGLDGAAGLNL
jgi:predicted lactoylglutathione lyase